MVNFNINCKHFSKPYNTCDIKGFSIFSFVILNQRCHPEIANTCKEKVKIKKPDFTPPAQRPKSPPREE